MIRSRIPSRKQQKEKRKAKQKIKTETTKDIDKKKDKCTLIFDNIHGYIEVDNIALSIIDTPEFQRLRHIHQGGVLYYVFPTANHSRFEHSIGTYHLAKKIINNIRSKQPELGITDEIVKVISIAGLCHDMGHVMYSHLFLSLIHISEPTRPY